MGNLKLIPQQRQLLTLALRQALEVLQMPQIELAQWLRSEIERNPLLELDEAHAVPSPTIEWQIPAPISLHEHLLAQIREQFPLAADRQIALDLLEHLDERGFLTLELTEKQAQILTLLQTFDPPGIFAQNLQQCLLLQLERREKAPTYFLIQNHFEDLLHRRFARIKKKLGSQALAFAIQTLSQLSLRPADAFKEEPNPPIIPDLEILPLERAAQSSYLAGCDKRLAARYRSGESSSIQEEALQNSLAVEVKEGELPLFYISSQYDSLEVKCPEERETLRSFKTQAKWICRSLSRRRKLLQKIGQFLIKKQASYFDRGGVPLAVSVKELADHLEIHESTVSRALAGKYASTPQGLIPLHSFFKLKPPTAKHLIERLIEQEDKQQPLTDEQISLQLQQKGLSVARRTIAKYRSQLKIGPALQRKNLM